MRVGLNPIGPKGASQLALRGRHLLIIDVVCVVAAFVLAFALRLDAPSSAFWLLLLRHWWLILPLLVFRVGANLLFKLYQRLWRYASIEEMQAIVLATATGSLLFSLALIALSFKGEGSPAYGFPRSVIAIEWLLSTAFLGGSRFSLRIMHAGRRVMNESLGNGSEERARSVLIVGAGDAGAMVAKELHLRPRLAMRPVGFVDDDPKKLRKWIHGVQVAGSRADLPELVRQLGAEVVIVAMPSAPGTVVREILQDCKKLGVEVMTVPGLAELISGEVTISQIRPVDVEDLLRREPTQLDLEAASGFLRGATVMITGAGGSIGSELCRQIATFAPARMILLGRGENSIYNIQMELEPRYRGKVELVPVIADVRDMPRLKALFRDHQPSVVFHAAAHKHVPLMEANASEAVSNNIFGTRNLLDVSEESGVDTFVLVSTDKAVNPANIMGATKRVAELLLQEAASRTSRRYVAVRFGNVLGSRGSVIPLFKQQIASGGPVTVTHPDITRYFMTIPEAVQLIIQAAALGTGGEIFVLDMGTPVRIYDLALDLIRLSGLEPFRDIDIQITGLRPGEKLYEELFTPAEQFVSTRNSRIFISSLQPHREDRLEKGLQELAALVSAGGSQLADIRRVLGSIIPEFAPGVAVGARPSEPRPLHANRVKVT